MDELKVKKCFKCNKTKELSDFYKHKEMADGHVNLSISDIDLLIIDKDQK